MSEFSEDDLEQIQALHRISGLAIDWAAERDRIRDTLDIADDVEIGDAVIKLVEEHEALEAEIAALAGDVDEDDVNTNLNAIEEILNDAAEVVKLIDPLLGGYSSEDDANTITLRAIVHRLSRKLRNR